MFGFMKKLTDKDKEEKERKRKERLEKEQKKVNGMTAEELMRLEEAKQSLQQKKNTFPVASPIPGDYLLKAYGSINAKSIKGPPPIVHPKPIRRGFNKEKTNIPSNIQKDIKHKYEAGFNNETGIAKEINCEQTHETNSNPVPNKDLNQKLFNSSFRKSKDSCSDTNVRLVSIQTNRSFTPKKIQCLPRTNSPSNKLYDTLSNKMAPLIPLRHLEPRKIILKRLQSGDFGFSLRKGVTVVRKSKPSDSDLWKQVIFAESGSKNINLGFLPGDRIVSVGNSNVENFNRETIVEILKKSGSQVDVVVQTIPELQEVVSRVEQNDTFSSNVKKDLKAKTEDQLTSDQLLLTSNDIWLVHQGGYSLGKLLQSTPSGETKVELEPGVVVVTEQDVEKVNPSYLSRTEDLTLLRYVNESSLLHVIRQRYYDNLIHTYAGFSTVVVNSVHPLSIYSEKIAQFFKETKVSDLPPHIFSAAQSAFKSMMVTRQDQSIVLMGRCRSGKSFQAQMILNYFITSHGSMQSVVSVDKLTAIGTLFESFATCKTSGGHNSSMFTQIFSLDFDQNGQISSASLQALMLERCKLSGSNHEDRFPIFSHFINGIDLDLRKDLHLTNFDSKHPFLSPLVSTEETPNKASHGWGRDLNAFKSLGVSEAEIKAFCLVLSSICHLKAAGAIKGPNNKHHFQNVQSAENASHILGISVDDLVKVIFQGQYGSSLTSLSPALRVAPSRENITPFYSGTELLELFCSGLYAELFNALVALINRSLSSNCRTMASISIVDVPGFRLTRTNGTEVGGANLSDLFHNYVQERLQNLFYENIFMATKELYSQEGLEIDLDIPDPYSPLFVQLIDNPPQSLTRSPECNGDLSSNRGLLWILDEQSLLPTSTDESFVEDLLAECSHFQLNNPMITASNSLTKFKLNHMNGSCPVEYEVSGWMKHAREGTVGRTAGPLLMDSKRSEICELFTQTCKTMGGASMSGSIIGLVDTPSSIKRASSMKRGFTSGAAAVRKRSLSLQIKFQTDALVDILKRTKISFVHCLLPHDVLDHPDILNVPLLRSQIRSFLILPSVRLFKQGFPENISLSDFIHKFRILAPTNPNDDEEPVKQILRGLELDPSQYHVGASKIFFHYGILNQLESRKEKSISNWLIKVQSISRVYLARKNLQKLKLQYAAISCIQKNVCKYMMVRDWAWWKLYLKVKPLLNVHRTEEELRDMQFEVDQLKQRLDKTEKEKQDYKQAYEKMEMNMTELSLELQDERNTSSQVAIVLESETTKRLLLERDIKEVQSNFQTLYERLREMENELMNVRIISSSMDSGDDDDDLGDSVYKERYEKLKKDHELNKRTSEMRFDEEKEDLLTSKKSLEKKITEMTAEEERLEKLLNETKRKMQKQSQEMADLKIHLEEQVSRNAELEKKQRRFDLDLGKVNDLLKDERSLREKLQKEKDDLISQKFSIEKELKNLEVDFDVQSQKLHKLELEVVELVSAGVDDKEAVKRRQLKNELEGKIKDLEEELDEQAGTIQQLEQAKLRLEMSQEKLRQQHSKELEEKENDLEELKRSFQKKFKTMEIQLEEEYEERQRCMKEKRELERKLQTVEGEKQPRDKDVEALLKRDLRRTKALLQDAQLVLQKYKESSGSRQSLKQLRDQLEDAEFARAAALKAKKSMELELDDLQQQLENMIKLKNEAEERFVMSNKEKHELQGRLEEGDEEMNELMKKYKAAVQQHSLDLIRFEEQSRQIEQLQKEKETMKEEMIRLQSRTDYFESSTVDKETIARLEVKVRDLEVKLDLEQTTKRRSEMQLSRLKEQMEAESDSRQSLKSDELRVHDQLRQVMRRNKELEEEANEVKLKESEAVKRRQELERKLEEMAAEHEQTQSDLHLAFKRIADLQAVIEDDIETNNYSEASDIDFAGSNDDDEDDDYDDDVRISIK